MKNLLTLVFIFFFAIGSLCAQTPDNGGSAGGSSTGGGSTIVGGSAAGGDATGDEGCYKIAIYTDWGYYVGVFYI